MRRIISLKKRKKFLKLIKCMMLLVVVISLFSLRMVKAGINDSKMEKNRMEGIYPITKINGVDRIFYLNMYTMNDIISYCIEIGVDMDTDIYNSTYDFSVSKLSSDKINYIRNLSYFGYGYNGHSDYRYYMATQELIWEYLSGVSVEWSHDLKVDGDRINIEKYKNDILNLVAKFNKGLDLKGYKEHKNAVIGDSFIINDINNNLKYYDVISGNHIKAKINGQYLEINISEDYVGSDKVILKRKNIYNHDSLLYYQGNSQKLISNGNIEERKELMFNIDGMNMSFLIVDNSGVKMNNQYGFEGIDYELYDSNGHFIDILMGSYGGKMSMNNMPYGNYCVRQISSNEAYKLNDKEYCFNFNGNVGVIYLEVMPKVNELEIFKLYGADDNLKNEEGALFEVYNKDGSLYDNILTDMNGEGKIIVPYGEYIIRQKNGQNGYYMVGDFEVDARWEDEVIRYTLVNEMIKTNLIINSKDIDGNIIKDKDIFYKVKDVASGQYIEKDGISEFQNIDGQALVLEKIGYGEYLIEVVDKSNFYEKVLEQLEIDINDSSLFRVVDGELYLNVDVNYEIVKGSVDISTIKESLVVNDGSYYYEYIIDSDVSVDLVAMEDIIINEQLMYKKQDNILNVVTDDSGKSLINDLYVGEYCLVSDGYNNVCFKIDDSETVEVELKKEIFKGNVLIHNVSSKFDNIGNSLIEVYDNSKNLLFRGITNESGIIKIDNLGYGDYCYKQVKVDDEYILNDKEYCFRINSNDVLELEIVNNIVGKKLIDVPNTYSDKKNVNKIIVFIMGIIGVIFYKIKICGSK